MPIGVIGRTDDVIVNSRLFHFGEKFPVDRPVVTALQMKNYFCLGKDLTAGATACGNKTAKIKIRGYINS